MIDGKPHKSKAPTTTTFSQAETSAEASGVRIVRAPAKRRGDGTACLQPSGRQRSWPVRRPDFLIVSSRFDPAQLRSFATNDPRLGCGGSFAFFSVSISREKSAMCVSEKAALMCPEAFSDAKLL